MVALIDKDYRIYDFIERFIAQNGYAPVVREIMDGASLSASSTESGLRKLKRAGLIDYQEGKPRTIVIPRYTLTVKAETKQQRKRSND